MASGGAAAAGAVENVVQKMTETVLFALTSANFNPTEIKENKLNLSQAYSLMWQEKESGEVSGRKSSMEKGGGAVAATILDLVVLGKIEIDIQPKKTLGISHNKNYVRVISNTPTDTYLDEAFFDKLLKRDLEKPDSPRELESIIRDSICKWNSDTTCVTAALSSLVDLGILDRQKKMIGYKFPTLNSAPEENFVRQIRQIALENAEPDSFMWTLLLLLRRADNLYICSDPLLSRHFSKEEYKGAKDRIKRLVGLGKEGKEKYEAI